MLEDQDMSQFIYHSNGRMCVCVWMYMYVCDQTLIDTAFFLQLQF